MVTQILTVNGMSCGHCKKAVENAAKTLPGVIQAMVDLEAKRLTVEFDPAKSSLESIKEAIIEEGFTVE